jgi:hypothetical protein
MQKKIINNTILIQHDDLKLIGKNIVIPSYYVDVILDYIKDYRTEGVGEADVDDYNAFSNFLSDVQEFKNQGN